jgi:hypothetical protein
VAGEKFRFSELDLEQAGITMKRRLEIEGKIQEERGCWKSLGSGI